MKVRSHILEIHPALLLLGSFLGAIAIGTGLLALPVSTRTGTIALIDALFTATSAVCVTGLAVVDTGSFFSAFGQLVILALIQVGGLGVMTISVMLFSLAGRAIPFRHRMIMQDVFAHTPRRDILKLVRSVVLVTLAVEGIGAILLAYHWSREMPLPQAIYHGVFHAVSAFCNAGFALYPDSLVRYADNALLVLTMSGLIVIGGIGFPVLFDLGLALRARHRPQRRLAVQTKTVLITTAVLIGIGALMFALLESHSAAGGEGWQTRVLTALFQSITCRTAGFNTTDIAALREATLVLMIFLMFVGASPGSCGGGVKTTTLALIVMFTLSRIRKLRRVNMFRRSIPAETVTRCISLLLVSIGILISIVFLLLVGDAIVAGSEVGPRHAFLPFFFETVSAFGTVGLSMGITPALTLWGKLLIIAMMILGRVGILTFSYVVVGKAGTLGLEYAEENLMIG
ncbi:MAG: ATPase [Candidatus Schekmanbacteria bacterium]|nr:ATPase [Candidatus Schekmanbacteria bacterium]